MRVTKKNYKGFSLVETVIAIGIVAILLTTFMSVFGPAQQSVNRSIGIADANRLVSTLENEMAIIRPGEETEYVTNGAASPFEKAFQWIVDSSEPQNAIAIYQYQASPVDSNNDNTLKAVTIQDLQAETSLSGRDYIAQTVARRVSGTSSNIENELQPGVVSGNVYVARMTQLIKNASEGKLELGSQGEIKNQDGGRVADSSNFEDAYITVQVEFFQLPNNLAPFVTGGNWKFDQLGAPVAVQNIAVRR